MGILYSIGEGQQDREALRTELREAYSPLVGFCIMLFTLISAPCVATLVTCRLETRSWRIALGQFAGLTALAYVITLVVYQVGSLLAQL
jgi:ferrous iron transport protein B